MKSFRPGLDEDYANSFTTHNISLLAFNPICNNQLTAFVLDNPGPSSESLPYLPKT